MIAPDLPAELRAALKRKARGPVPQRCRGPRRCDLANISRRRRLRRDPGETDALAYALARMPATYAAVVASLNALREIVRSSRRKPARRRRRAGHRDMGGGAGVRSLDEFAAIDANPVLRTLALDLAADERAPARHPLCAKRSSAGLRDAASADLVIASYVIGEIRMPIGRRCSPS